MNYKKIKNTALMNKLGMMLCLKINLTHPKLKAHKGRDLEFINELYNYTPFFVILAKAGSPAPNAGYLVSYEFWDKHILPNFEETKHE